MEDSKAKRKMMETYAGSSFVLSQIYLQKELSIEDIRLTPE